MNYTFPPPDVSIPTELSPHTYFVPVDYYVHPKERPPSPAIRARIGAKHESYRNFLRGSLQYQNQFRRIPVEDNGRTANTEPVWINEWFSALDAISLYTLIAHSRPTTYIEIGSGHSTRFARRAIEDFGLATRLCSIDPTPRTEIDELCDEVIRQPLESIDLDVFRNLGVGDFAFLDGSHRVFQNSDATIFLTEIVPSLTPGVIVGIHDVFLPYDYPTAWLRRYYSEQYLLGCYLLGGDAIDVLCPVHYISKTPDLLSVLDPIWNDPALPGLWKVGGMFWFTRAVADQSESSGIPKSVGR
ncbi:class I SAM-dependent methyltransferase [Rhodovulum sp. PH10]|uniref:class I SAM-dependent methyltransferase n=1 Tax=Rhodovulum sp. PH10 TaxID=1187851 RepID=UPI0012F893ED|nr:class I SAM-dependent methyltransferase [Rhodovulum sp. PH10]